MDTRHKQEGLVEGAIGGLRRSDTFRLLLGHLRPFSLRDILTLWLTLASRSSSPKDFAYTLIDIDFVSIDQYCTASPGDTRAWSVST